MIKLDTICHPDLFIHLSNGDTLRVLVNAPFIQNFKTQEEFILNNPRPYFIDASVSSITCVPTTSVLLLALLVALVLLRRVQR